MKSIHCFLYGALFILLFSLISDSTAKVLNVCPFDCRYSLIQKAIDDAKQGDTVIVQNGIYTENIILNKNNLVVIAAGNLHAGITKASMNSGFIGDRPLIKGKGQGKNVVKITGSGIILKGFEITGGTYDCAIKISGSSNIISDCNIHSQTGR